MPASPAEQAKNERVEILARRPHLKLRLGERVYDVLESSVEPGGGRFALSIDGHPVEGFRFVDRDRTWIRVEGRTFAFERASVTGAGAAAGGGKSSKGEVVSDMPGTVVAVHVKEGDHVSTGDALLTIESMKLQITVGAERDGVVAKIAVEPNATFDRGALLVIVRPEEGTAAQ